MNNRLLDTDQRSRLLVGILLLLVSASTTTTNARWISLFRTFTRCSVCAEVTRACCVAGSFRNPTRRDNQDEQAAGREGCHFRKAHCGC
jgi:hypothetical protein